MCVCLLAYYDQFPADQLSVIVFGHPDYTLNVRVAENVLVSVLITSDRRESNSLSPRVAS